MNDMITPEQAFEPVSAWGEHGEFSMEGSVWLAWLHVAQWYGWSPAGTLPPDPDYVEFDGRGRDGSYYPPAGQRVSEEDAKQLGRALERALADIPDGPAWDDLPDGYPYAGWYEQSSSLMQRLGPIKSLLQSFITYCQECGELWLF